MAVREDTGDDKPEGGEIVGLDGVDFLGSYSLKLDLVWPIAFLLDFG